MSDTRAASQTVRYRERLSVPLWWWLPGLGLAALIALEFNQGVRVLPDWVAYAVLLPVAYYTGTDFKPAGRKPLEDILHVNGW